MLCTLLHPAVGNSGNGHKTGLSNARRVGNLACLLAYMDIDIYISLYSQYFPTICCQSMCSSTYIYIYNFTTSSHKHTHKYINI